MQTIRVLQSFPTPRSTTNPYIHMLDAALAATPGIAHRTFSWKAALLLQYDVIHFHWPEVLIEGRSPLRRFVKRARLQALLWGLRLRRIVIARTIHNLELPSDISGWDRRMLESIRSRATINIALNDSTPIDPRSGGVVIPHGHYVDWFAAYPKADADPNRVSFVGLVRRYKGVEGLLEAFADLHATTPDLTLAISGNPTSDELREEIIRQSAANPAIVTDFRYLTEADYATAVTASGVVALPYTHMHNSGSVLAALSLDRPVLVPDTEVNRALAAEVGEGWVQTYSGTLSADDLSRAVDAAGSLLHSERGDGGPDLSDRGWDTTGQRHRDAYAAGIARRNA